MLVIGVICVIIGSAPDTLNARSDTLGATVAPSDTVRRRPRSVQVSEWYDRRLTIHRYVSYATLPVFTAQWVAGNQLYQGSKDAPGWAKTTHRAGATALAGMFGVNTVTGLWNLWDSRSVPQGRLLRTTHALMMLAADAGFTYAGVRLSEQAETDAEKRKLHRTIALSSMGVATISGFMMKYLNH